MKIADMPDPPLRIQLGTECLLAVRNKAKRTVRDGENREELAHPTLTRAWCSRCSWSLTTERRVQACRCEPVYAVPGALYDSGGAQQVSGCVTITLTTCSVCRRCGGKTDGRLD